MMTEDQLQQQQQNQSTKDGIRKSIHEMRNQDFVSRLLAATPPYLYSTPVGSNNFFFSDMLRSLVQAKNNETARHLHLQQQQQQQQQQQAAIARRPRKRSWSQQRPAFYEHPRERKDVEVEKPLELTNKQLFPIAAKYTKPEGGAAKEEAKSTEMVETTPSDVVLPPPPPVWYPPLYPPYGIDPLHFFIDLRVSGHIYDRKKENGSPADNNNLPATTPTPTPDQPDAFGKPRHGSAFTVPAKSSSAINLSASSALDPKYYDLGEAKENLKSAPNYMLPRLYNQFGVEDENKSELGDAEDHDNSSQANIDVEMIDTLRYRCEPSRGASDDGSVHEIE